MLNHSVSLLVNLGRPKVRPRKTSHMFYRIVSLLNEERSLQITHLRCIWKGEKPKTLCSVSFGCSVIFLNKSI
jgi:hypothetical protein